MSEFFGWCPTCEEKTHQQLVTSTHEAPYQYLTLLCGDCKQEFTIRVHGAKEQGE